MTIMGHILFPSISTGQIYHYPRQGLGLINYTSGHRMHKKRQGCTHTDGPEHRKFIIFRLDTQQAPSSRKWPGKRPSAVVLGAGKEIPTVMQGVLTAGGGRARGLGSCFGSMLSLTASTPRFLSLGTTDISGQTLLCWGWGGAGLCMLGC